MARSIVLIDDDMDDREIFETACMTVDPSIKVIGFESGELALESLLDMRPLPDLIFLDLNMPRLNGIDVLEAIRSRVSLKEVPIVVYTTSFDLKVKNKCSELGAAEVIEKPNSFDALCQKLESLLHISA